MTDRGDWTEPTGQELDLVLGRLGNEQHRRYFYERLQNPRWLPRLRERGVFASPPQPWTDAEGETRLPRWPEGDYLARMAPADPDLAVEIANAARGTPNSLVHNAFVEVALAAPAPQSARLVPLAREWLDSPYRGWLSTHRLAEWVGHLARGGQGKPGLTLARMLIEIRRGDTPARTGRGRGTRARAGVTTWLDYYEYAEVVRAMLPDLVAAEGLQAIEVMSDQLDSWLRHGGQGVAAEHIDYSWLWRPSIASHEQNMGNTVEDAVIDGVRDGARLLAQRDKAQIPALVEALERRRWTVFRRLALHLLADVVASGQPDGAVLAAARERVINSQNLNDHTVVHEYSELARAVLPTLDDAAIAEWMGLIDAGPTVDEEELRERLAATADTTVDERVVIYRDVWRRDRLGAVLDGLPNPLRERYRELAERFGDADHSEFASYMTAMWTGPTSPRTLQEILELSIDELVSYLTHWRPEPSFWPPGPSVEGLARELTAAVTANPSRFAEHAESFTASGRSFVRAVLEGFEAALREGRSFTWPPVIGLCAVVAAETEDAAEGDAHLLDEDPSWRWAQKAAASLLLQGLQPSTEELPDEVAEQVLTVLSRLVESSDPGPDRGEQRDDTVDDPVTTALNSTRGQAVRALIAFATWRVRHGDTEADLGKVVEILDRHLDPGLDSSPAVRSVYGQHFGVLLHVMPEWAGSRSANIFGPEFPLDVRQHAAGAAYLAFNRPTVGLLDALRLRYKTWVKAVAAGDFDQEPLYSLDSIAERLAAHLLLLYSWGRIELHDGLLAEFFQTAPIEVRRDALAHVGWQLWRSTDSVPADVLQRLTALWESRRDAVVGTTEAAGEDAEQDTAKAELAAFGWWFRSDRFDRHWALRELLVALENSADVETASVDVTEQLTLIADTDPELALRILDRLLQMARQGGRMSQVVRHGIGILRLVLDSGQARLVADADRIINEIARSGFLDIRDRVQQHSAEAT